MARICITLGEYKKGLDWLDLSSKNFQTTGLVKSMAINNKILGRYYMTTNNYREAFKNFQIAEKGLLISKDSVEQFYIYMNILDYYMKTNDLNKAKVYANLCLTQCKHYTDQQMITLIYNNMGEIQNKQKNYAGAIENFQKTLNTPAKYSSSKYRISNAHIGMSKNLMQLFQPEEALQHAIKAQNIASSSGIKQLQLDANINLAECYKDLKNDKLANLYLDSAIRCMDITLQESSETTKAFYDTKNELAKVAANLEIIRQQKESQRFIFILIIFVLFTMIILVLYIYKLQRSKNDVLKELVKKNFEIIEDERKLSLSLQNQTDIKKANRKSIDNEKSDILFINFTIWLEKDKKFTQSDLTLEIIAKELNTNRDYLSRAINDQKLRFNDLINKYRILEAIQILTESVNKNGQYKLQYIAKKVGFNSNSAFIAAFKKQTGLNPAVFCKNIITTVTHEENL